MSKFSDFTSATPTDTDYAVGYAAAGGSGSDRRWLFSNIATWILAKLAASATTDTTNAANISSGTLPAGRLPNPASSTLGGVKSLAAVSHQFLTSISTSGAPTQAQPAAADISGLASSATTDTTNAANISSGILAQANGGQALSPMYASSFWYASSTVTGSAGGAGAAGQIFFQPIWIGSKCTIEAIAVKVATGGAGASPFACALYSSVGNRPGTLLANTGGSLSTATGAISLALTSNYSVVTPGWYWLAFQYGDTTQRMIGPGVSEWTKLVGATTLAACATPISGMAVTGSVGTWPSPPTGFTEGSAGVDGIWFAVQIASVP